MDRNRTRQNPDERHQAFQSKIDPLYRALSAEERPLVTPEQEDVQTFAENLGGKAAGEIKLIADKGCDKQFNVIVSSEHCLKYTMPGAGASYSFRTGNYRLRHLADLKFGGENFQTSSGFLIHGILVNIGNVPLGEINPQNAALATLLDFQPVTDFEKAAAFASVLEKGLSSDDLRYASVLPVKLNSTYLLRSIAYRGKSFREVDAVVYDEFDFDKRKDVVLVFRVIRYKPNESVTILWKELERKDAPRLKWLAEPPC